MFLAAAARARGKSGAVQTCVSLERVEGKGGKKAERRTHEKEGGRRDDKNVSHALSRKRNKKEFRLRLRLRCVYCSSTAHTVALGKCTLLQSGSTAHPFVKEWRVSSSSSRTVREEKKLKSCVAHFQEGLFGFYRGWKNHSPSRLLCLWRGEGRRGRGRNSS